MSPDRIVVAGDLASTPVSGVVIAGGREVEFTGWIGLIRALEIAAEEGSPQGEEPD